MKKKAIYCVTFQCIFMINDVCLQYKVYEGIDIYILFHIIWCVSEPYLLIRNQCIFSVLARSKSLIVKTVLFIKS